MVSFPDLIIFDCDGVLVDSEAMAARVVSETLGQYGITLSAEELGQQYAGHTDDAIRDHFNKMYDAKLPENFAQIIEEETIRLFPGVLETLPYIKDVLPNLEYPYCVASNSRTDRLNAALEATGLGDHFPLEKRFSSSLVQNPKPAADLHLLACQKMGVDPEKALVIEDTVTGVRAATAAGISVMGFVGAEHIVDKKAQSQKLMEAGAITVFDDMRQLTMMLREYSQS